MNLEKNCYSLLGCLAVGSILQKNMNLHGGYFVVITLLLWGGCISTQMIVSKKKENANNLVESSRQETVNKQFEYLSKSISKIQSEQTDIVIRTIRELNLVITDKLVELQVHQDKISKEWTIGQNKKIDDICTVIKENEQNNSELIESMKKLWKSCKDDSDERCKILFEDCKNAIISSTDKNNSEILVVCTNIKETIEKVIVQLEELQSSNVECFSANIKGINESLESFKITAKECKESSVGEITLSINRMIEAIESGIGTVNKEFTKEITMMKKHLDEISSLQINEKVNIKKKIAELSNNVLGGISNIQTTISDINDSAGGIQRTNADSLKKMVELSNNVLGGISNIQTIINDINDSAGDIQRTNADSLKKIAELSNNVLGGISNIQTTIEIINGSVDDIQKTNADSLDKLEDVKGVITEKGEDCAEKISDLMNVMRESADKQLEIISGENDILNQYDKLISYINDEVVVKLISDSDNLLKCMKDCYSLLESLRKVRR